MDRFQLQIQIASEELKLQKLLETKSRLELQVAAVLSQLARLHQQLGQGGLVSQPVEPTCNDKRQALLQHLQSRCYHRVVQSVVDTGRNPAGSTYTVFEEWANSQNPNLTVVLLIEKLSSTNTTLSFRMFLNSQMCPAEALP